MADMVPQGTQLHGVPQGHESTDANMRSVTVAVVIVLTSTVVAMLSMAGMFRYLYNRESAKDIGVPDTFALRQLPPGPPLLPSPKQDELPWAAYQNERRAQEGEAIKYGIINRKTGAYVVPSPSSKDLPREEVAREVDSYFKSKSQWEQGANRYTRDSSGGTTGGVGGAMTQDESDAQRRFGTNGSSAPPAQRPGDEREIGPKQISTSEH